MFFCQGASIFLALPCTPHSSITLLCMYRSSSPSVERSRAHFSLSARGAPGRRSMSPERSSRVLWMSLVSPRSELRARAKQHAYLKQGGKTSSNDQKTRHTSPPVPQRTCPARNASYAYWPIPPSMPAAATPSVRPASTRAASNSTSLCLF